MSPSKDGVIKTFSWSELNDMPPLDIVIHLAGKVHDTKNKTGSKAYGESVVDSKESVVF